MGKRIIPQRRGRGGMQYRSPGHTHKGVIRHPPIEGKKGVVVDLIHDPGRIAPLAKVSYEGKIYLQLAADGISVGDEVSVGVPGDIKAGSTIALGLIPEGTTVFNIEKQPGDGGKYVRGAGTGALVITQGVKTNVRMPSGELKMFDPKCRATIGFVAGSGHLDRPLAKAGKKYHAYKRKSKAHLKVSGVAMNAVDHPHGGGAHQHVGIPSTVSRNAPPGRKVGQLSPKKRSGKKNRRMK